MGCGFACFLPLSTFRHCCLRTGSSHNVPVVHQEWGSWWGFALQGDFWESANNVFRAELRIPGRQAKVRRQLPYRGWLCPLCDWSSLDVGVPRSSGLCDVIVRPLRHYAHFRYSRLRRFVTKAFLYFHSETSVRSYVRYSAQCSNLAYWEGGGSACLQVCDIHFTYVSSLGVTTVIRHYTVC